MELIGDVYLFVGLTLGAIALIQLIALNFKTEWYLFNMLGQFALHGWFLAAFNLIGALITLNFILAAALVLILAGISWHLRPHFFRYRQFEKPTEHTPDGQVIRLMSHNVLHSNRRKQQLAEAILEHDPDLVVLQEVDQLWLARLDEILGHKYSFKLEYLRQPEEDSYGIALYSKYPLKGGIKLVADVPYTDVEISIPGSGAVLNVIGLHLLNPIYPKQWRDSAQQLDTILGAVDSRANTVLIGDFNVSTTGTNYRKILRSTELEPVRYGGPLSPTWYRGVLPMLKLDHTFVSANVRVQWAAIGKRCGSDHKSIMVALQI